MNNAQEDFNRAVDAAPIQDPIRPIIGNVNARPLTSAAEIKADLQAQLTSRVRWTESIQYMLSQDVKTFVEIGSGSVLAGLIKRIDREAKTLSVGMPEDIERLLSA
jgi:[acyl-carrier-protein] S-malonyltransferase